MDAMRIFRKDYVIGLDIGSSSVKLVQFARREDGLNLVGAGLKEIEEASDDGFNEKEKISALRSLLSEVDVKRSEAIVSINCPMTSIQKLRVPYMPKGELQEGLRLEAKNYFPFPIDNAILEFEILGDIVEKGIRKYEVIAVASPRATIEAYIALLNKVGIKPASLIPSSYALRKIGGHLLSLAGGEDKTLSFLDIGRRYTELLVFKGKDLAFSRKLPVSGGDFTKAMTAVLVSDRGKTELSFSEAEEIKREIGIPRREGESRIIHDKISTTQVLSMLRTPFENLTNEIERCFDYYREKNIGGEIASLVLFGGGASLAGLPESLTERLGIEAKLGDALEGLKVEPVLRIERAKVSHRLEFAIGAALAGAKGINLLPSEIKEEAKRTFKRATLNGIVTAVILIAILLHVGIKIELANLRKKIDVTRMELLGLQPQLRLAETQMLMNKVLADEPYWEDVFKEIGNIIPEDIHLTELSVKNKIITMKGVISSKEKEVLLSNFILDLEKGIFHGVKLVRSEDKDIGKQSITEFEIKCWVD